MQQTVKRGSAMSSLPNGVYPQVEYSLFDAYNKVVYCLIFPYGLDIIPRCSR